MNYGIIFKPHDIKEKKKTITWKKKIKYKKLYLIYIDTLACARARIFNDAVLS